MAVIISYLLFGFTSLMWRNAESGIFQFDALTHDVTVKKKYM